MPEQQTRDESKGILQSKSDYKRTKNRPKTIAFTGIFVLAESHLLGFISSFREVITKITSIYMLICLNRSCKLENDLINFSVSSFDNAFDNICAMLSIKFSYSDRFCASLIWKVSTQLQQASSLAQIRAYSTLNLGDAVGNKW